MSALVPKVTRELTKMKRTLREVFNLDKLRPGQAEVIRSVLEGDNTLAIMPTGAGKSLCYQLPTLHLPGTTVVVSPLIALMKDQVDKLEDAGLEASQLNSALNTREHEENLQQIKTENSDFIFVTPERLTTPEFLAELRKQTINFVVIDEAHCISEWGHDFRPAYLSLGSAVKSLGSPPVLALTATATPEVTADIEKQLDIGKLRVIKTGIYRPNLHFEVKRVTNELEKHEELVRVLREHEGTGIIYCATVKTVEALTDWLKDFDFKVEKYHGRMKASDRKQNQEAFMAGELKAIVATNAFGMGIDKPDIRFVVHYQMPGSLEAYYQEAGRAGRDGEPALCSLFYQLEDRRTQQFFIGRKRRVSEEQTEKEKEKLERMMAYGQSATCRWRLLHDYFEEEMEEERCGTCDNCVHPLEEQLLAGQRTSTTTQIDGHA
jgi:ATP-dependent DNA helicase RecQ